MAKLLRGAEVVSALNRKILEETNALKTQDIVPTLALVRAGERADDLAYERGAMKRAGNVGIEVKQFILPADVSQTELIETIRRINADETIHGVLIFRPLPKHIDDAAVRAALLPEKDVDGITEGSLSGVFAGTGRGFPPCTAQACIETLDYYGVEMQGKNVVVIGRSLVIGKPVAMMLLQRNATVTICHTKTKNMAEVTRQADILIVAAGRAGVIGADYVSAGQTVIDVGINFNETGGMMGDADFGAVEPIVGAISPVPGGVGTVTTSVLMNHVAEAARRTARAK